jgi:hypothetical protein
LACALLNKPSAYGFETELWTLKRVGALIHRLYGVKFGLTNIWLILGALSFSLTLSQIQSLRDRIAMRAAPQGANELNAQQNAQRRDRVGHMALGALGAPGFPGARNLRERQASGIGRRFFLRPPLR